MIQQIQQNLNNEDKSWSELTEPKIPSHNGLPKTHKTDIPIWTFIFEI